MVILEYNQGRIGVQRALETQDRRQDCLDFQSRLHGIYDAYAQISMSVVEPQISKSK